MSNIKKAFLPIVELLQAAVAENSKVRVSEVLDGVLDLASAKSGAGGGKATTFHRNEAGEVTAVKCYYHNLWMDPRVAEFGEKKSSASGLNSMCKDGMSKWTKQNSEFKKAQAELLSKVSSGEINPSDIAAHLQNLEATKDAIVAREDGYGFATLEEVQADSVNRGLSI